MYEFIEKINENTNLIDVAMFGVNEVGAVFLVRGGKNCLIDSGSKKDTGNTIYILDEPTTGLHFEDIRLLLGVLNQLVDKGNTIVIIEHNMDVIKVADYIIDMGPEGGSRGGTVVVKGTPEQIIKNKKSHTGVFLKEELK